MERCPPFMDGTQENLIELRSTDSTVVLVVFHSLCSPSFFFFFFFVLIHLCLCLCYVQYTLFSIRFRCASVQIGVEIGLTQQIDLDSELKSRYFCGTTDRWWRRWYMQGIRRMPDCTLHVYYIP